MFCVYKQSIVPLLLPIVMLCKTVDPSLKNYRKYHCNMLLPCLFAIFPSIYMYIHHDSLHARNACLPTFRSRWLPVRLPDCLNQPIEVFICFHSNKSATVSYERPVQIITEMQRLASIQVKIECISNGHHQLPHSHMVLSYRSQTVRRPTADAFICLSVSHMKSHLWSSYFLHHLTKIQSVNQY